VSKPLVIFGTGDIAELAHFYFSRADRTVAAFTVDGAYVKEPTFRGLPVVPFEEVQACPSARRVRPVRGGELCQAECGAQGEVPGRARHGVPAGQLRQRQGHRSSTKAASARTASSSRTTPSSPFATIGNNVTLWSGNHIGHHSTIADHCFLASHVVVSGGVEIGEQCFVGVNVTLRDHVRIGARCVLGAGALLLQDAEPEGVYMGTGTERSRVPSSRLRGI
jgi:hypothetical protein